MKNFKIFIFQIGNSYVIKKLLIYEILNNLESNLSNKETFASHIQKSLFTFLIPYTFPS